MVRNRAQNLRQMVGRRGGVHGRGAHDDILTCVQIQGPIEMRQSTTWINREHGRLTACGPDAHGSRLQIKRGLIFGQKDGLRGLDGEI